MITRKGAIAIRVVFYEWPFLAEAEYMYQSFVILTEKGLQYLGKNVIGRNEAHRIDEFLSSKSKTKLFEPP